MMAQIGIVITHAQTFLSTTVHLTALSPLVAPTPMTELEMTWVVESGMPQWVATSMIAAAVVCAPKPWMGCMRTMERLMVLIIFHPPAAVPAAMVMAHTILTHTAMSKVGVCIKLSHAGKPANA